jgi:M6 family metalloprotease-like protein
MGPHPIRLALAALSVSLLSLPRALSAQDVLEQGRVHGVSAPESMLRVLERDPGAFEFKRAWRNRTARARAQRTALEDRRGPRLSVAQIQGAAAAVTGTMRVPVLLGLPSDATAPYSPAAYQARLFGDVAGVYSARTFYREMSRGAFTLDGTASGWIPVSRAASYYYPSATTDDTYGRTGEFLRDVLVGADPAIDFGRFDNDGPDGTPNSGDDDGYVDAAAFIYPAHGKACGGPGIWPHRWTYSARWGAPFATNDVSARGGTIKVDDYLIQGGLECDGSSLMQIGTFSHEMGHALALPDLYDTDRDNGSTEGVGEWDLMGAGNYRRPDAPAHMSAWSKDFLGWVSVETFSPAAGGLSLDPVYTAGRVLRYDIPNTREYFLLEQRAATGSDRNLHGPGMLLYHVDPAVLDTTLLANRVNANPRRGVDLEEADGLDHLDQGAGNRGDAGDPFPGRAAKTAFGDATYPSSRSNAGAPSGLELRNIVLSAGRLTFDVGATAPAPVATVTVSPATGSIAVGGTRQLSATLRDASGNALTGRGVAWSSARPGVASVSATGLVSAAAAGGPVVITASSEGRSGTAQITVIPAAMLTLGDSLAGTLVATGERDTVTVALTAGDVVDLGAFRTGGKTLLHPEVQLRTPDGAVALVNRVDRTSPRATLVARYTAPATGTYRLIVYSRYSGETGSYIVRTRRSGPVIAYTGRVPQSTVPAGSGTVTRDTLYVYNAGSGSLSFTLTGGGAPWLSVSPTGGTAAGTLSPEPAPAAAPPAEPGRSLAGPRPARAPGRSGTPRVNGPLASARTAPERAPAGAAAIVVAQNPAGLAQGFHSDSIVVRSTQDVWNTNVVWYPSIRVYDPRAQVLDTTLYQWPGGMALDARGDLFVAVNADIVRVDPRTGAATPWAANVADGIEGMEFGPDSALYVADQALNRVVRVDRDGRASTFLAGNAPVYDVALLPDGTLFAAVGGSLVRRLPRGETATVLSTSRRYFTSAIVYNPTDGWLYYTADVSLRRYHPTSGVDEFRGFLPSTSNSALLTLVVGRGGRLYGTEDNTGGSVLALETTGVLAARYWQPSLGYGLVVSEGALVGNGFIPGDMLWSIPVSDGPAGTVLRGDVNGDGSITAQDALGVLAVAVGKPVPAGWDAAKGGDADCNGTVDSLDALIILSRVVGKDVTQFCVGTTR